MQLKTKIILGSLASLALLSAILILGWQANSRIADKQYGNAVLNGRVALWIKVVAQEYTKMKSDSRRVKRNNSITKSLSLGQKDILGKYALEDYNGLSSAKVITNLSITNSTGRPLFSANDIRPDQYKTAIQYTLKNKKSRYDIVENRQGNIEFIFTFPLYFNRQVVGVAIFAKSLENAVSNFTKSNQTTAYIITPHGKVPFDQNKDLLKKIATLSPKDLSQKYFNYIQINNTHFNFTIFPLMDQNNKTIATLITLQEDTENFTKMQDIYHTIYGAVAFFFLLTTLGLFLYLRRKFSPLDAIVTIITKLSKGDLSVNIPKDRKDEIGALIKTLHVFKKNVLEVNQRQKEKEIEAQNLYAAAYYDALTKLPNRALFLEKLQRIVEKNQRNQHHPAALFFIDLDRFKAVNDSMGHDAGDELLRQASARLQKIARAYEAVSRLGGDEFTIIIESIDDKKLLLKMADRFLTALTKPFNIMEKEVHISGSIGIYMISKNDKQADNILRNADLAMYKAKKNGRSCCEIFHEDQLREALSFIQVQNGLRTALKNKEIRVYYQPIVDVATVKLAGFESLVRWQHPKHGLIHPNQFIPVAEETGLIKELGLYVLKESCQQIKFFQNLTSPTTPLTIAVNLSPNQITNEESIKSILSVIKKANLPKNILKVECTETALIKNSESMLSFFHDLKALNVQLCIDDFGTGYSALEYIHKYPFDILKIDRSFISTITKNKKDLNLVSGIVSLAHNMGLRIVAEGVEYEEEIRHLLKMNVDFFQGFYFAKPLPFEEACTFIKEKNSFNWNHTIEYVTNQLKRG